MNSEDFGAYHESILDKEVRKTGGVYYTPPLIVDYMVAESVGEFLQNKTPDEAAKLKSVDPACGGGVFLLGAYQFLLDWHERYFGKLTLAKRRKILTSNIFGVDIDPLAVEITKYCLSMKCSEGKDFSLDIASNVRCGNALIDTDSFDWQRDFSHVFKQGGFDIVIGSKFHRLRMSRGQQVCVSLLLDIFLFFDTSSGVTGCRGIYERNVRH